MSPVCKKSLNYVMSFPCPHCGSEKSYTERDTSEIKPVISKEFQATFEKPPLSKSSSMSDLTQSDNSSKAHVPSNIKPTIQKQITEPEEGMESLIITMSNDMKALTTDIRTMMKSMKVVERVLTNMNKELRKLREK